VLTLLQALTSYLLVWAYLGSAASPSLAERQLSVAIDGGRFEPMYPAADGERTTTVRGFRLDRRPVSNAEFRSFVLEQPSWRRDRVSSLFAEGQYLAHWQSATELGARAPGRAPVINVSWFAAKAYCKARGARLPSELEWEYAAAASESVRDARRDPAFNARILSWYSKPSEAVLADVGAGTPNAFGVYDLHGLVWEWVVDFNSTLVSSDSRSTRAADKQTFCGAGASSARDVSDYAAFMRVAFLSSLTARDVTQTLGFRCASDETEGS
jgi:formylglycine-generating enzyme required for sulfatase activity